MGHGAAGPQHRSGACAAQATWPAPGASPMPWRVPRKQQVMERGWEGPGSRAGHAGRGQDSRPGASEGALGWLHLKRHFIKIHCN